MVRKAPRRVRIRNPLSGKHRAPHYSSSGTAGKTASLTTPPNTEPSKTWASRHDRGSFRVVIAPRLPRQAPPAALPLRTRPGGSRSGLGPEDASPVVGKDLRVALTGSWAGCRQRRDPDGSAPKALRLVIATLAALLGRGGKNGYR